MVSPYCEIDGVNFSALIKSEGVDISGGGAGVTEISTPYRNYADVRNSGRKMKKYTIITIPTSDRAAIETFLETVNNAEEDAKFYPFDANRFGKIASAHASISSAMALDRQLYQAKAEIACRESWLYGPNKCDLAARPGHILATGGGGGTLAGNSPNLGGWETFTLVDMGSGKVALKCYDGVHYVAAVGGGGGVVYAESTYPDDWETFTLVDMGAGKVALKCFDDTHYVGLTDANGTSIYAKSTYPGAWETFTPIDMSPGTIFQSYAIVDYLDSVTNEGHIDAPVELAVSSSNFWVSNLSLRIGMVEMDRYILLLEGGLGHDLFELNARGQVTHSWEADLTQTLSELSERVHGKTSGGAISGGVLTLDNSDYFMIPFYGPLPLSGDPGAAWIEVVLSAIAGDEATVQIAKETDLSDMVAVEHDALVLGTNKIFIPELTGEDHVAIGIKAGASGSVSITGLSAAVKRYVAPSTIPRIKKDETATIVVGYTAGRLISAAATVNDRFWY